MYLHVFRPGRVEDGHGGQREIAAVAQALRWGARRPPLVVNLPSGLARLKLEGFAVPLSQVAAARGNTWFAHLPAGGSPCWSTVAVFLVLS